MRSNKLKFIGENNRAVIGAVLEQWMPQLEKYYKNMGMSVDEQRLQRIALMAHTRVSLDNIKKGGRALFESTATPANVPGAGNPVMGAAPTSLSNFYNGTRGSGDVFQDLFGVFLEVAAQNIGMELVPTVPMAKSQGTIFIAEPIYGDGKLDNASDRPTIIQVTGVATGTAPTLAVGTTYTVKTAAAAGEDIMTVIYVGRHRINGNYIFKIGTVNDNSGAAGTDWTVYLTKDLFDTTNDGAAIYTDASNYLGFDDSTVDYVEGLTNVVLGYSGAGSADTNAWFLNRHSGTNYSQAMTRGTGEAQTYRSMALRTWSRHFSANTFQVDLELTNANIQDMLHDHGLDALELSDEILVDQLNQNINDSILSRIFMLGWSHHKQLLDAQGVNMNLNLDLSGNTGAGGTFPGKDGSNVTIAAVAGSLPASGTISENMSTLQRRLVSRILYAANMVGQRCRRGKGDTCVLNSKLATALVDVAGFQPAPSQNSLSNSDVSYLGDLFGVKIYEDSVMSVSDGRVAVFRKGDEKDPGLKFSPYVMAESISTIAEATMAPKTALISRYALPECGSNPELNYLTFNVASAAGFDVV